MHVTDQVIQSLFHTLHQDQAQPADDDDDSEAVWRWLALFEALFGAVWRCLALTVAVWRCLVLFGAL